MSSMYWAERHGTHPLAGGNAEVELSNDAYPPK
jgi:hypothetical protein